MELGLTSKVALVCASSSGLGRAIASRLAREGASVILSGRNTDKLQALSAQISSAGGKCVAVAGDLTDARARERLVKTGVDMFGPVDILVSNTAGPPTGLFVDHSLEAWRASYEAVVEPVVHLLQLVLPSMKRRHFGRVLAIGSFAARAPADALVLSSSLRAAVIGLIKSIATEYGPDGVTANSLLPGYFLTDRMRAVATAQIVNTDGSSDAALASIVGTIPLRRCGDPDECGAVATFFLSQLAGYVTGATFTVDGGMVRSVY